VDAMRVSIIKSGDSLSTQQVQTVEVSELMAVDIDTELDFRFCELLLEEHKASSIVNSVHDSQG
jgi:sugar O-acyltransferase (sialic acid O-acetyltransferase NeuD family)